MRWRELITDPGTKLLSHTKLGALVFGYPILGVAFLIDAIRNGLTSDKILAYGVVVIGGAAASKWLSTKYRTNGGPDAPAPR